MKRLHHKRWLDSHFNLEATAGKVEGLALDRAEKLASCLGNPEKSYPAIHLTGTNGKGSTAHILSLVLAEAGLKVGTYSSPHLVSLNERFQINGVCISDRDLDALLGELKSLEESLGEMFSWFELVTAAAFLWFAINEVDVAVIEVGKLGRYDATNIISAGVCVVTNISKDHTDGTGEWEKAIAWEKAGIIKANSTLILGDMREKLREIFLAENPASVYLLGKDFSCLRNEKAECGRILDIENFGNGSIYENLHLSMHGIHQGQNATLALAAAKAHLMSQKQEHLLTADAAAGAFAKAGLAGRYEILSRNPLLILEGGHNPAGALVARETLDAFLPPEAEEWKNSTLIFGITSEKSPQEMLKSLRAQTFSRVICTSLANPRTQDPCETAKAAQDMGINAYPVQSAEEALAYSEKAGSAVTFVCGSLYLAGAIKQAYEAHRKQKVNS